MRNSARKPPYLRSEARAARSSTEKAEEKTYELSSSAATVRKRQQIPRNATSDQAAAQRNSAVSGKGEPWKRQPGARAPGNSLLSDVAGDGWTLTKTVLRLPKTLYPLWKWVLLAYLLWLAVSYLLVYVYTTALASASATVCPIPILGSYIPFCASWNARPFNVSKVATSQEELADVMDQVGQGFDLARDMVGHEFAVRDLKIRVAASKLPRKQELAQELDSLVRYTKQAARGLSRFTAKFGKSIDTARTFDEYAVKALEGIVLRRQNLPTLPARVMGAISPLAAFDMASSGDSEEQVKRLFIHTASRISDKVKLLLDESFDLSHTLDTIQETLDRIKEIMFDEYGDLPRRNVLSALWLSLAYPDEYEQHRSHEVLLTDMGGFYASSSSVMRETTLALNHIEAELSEFRDDFATPGLILRDFPLELIIALLRNSAERLTAGKLRLEYVEEGGRTQRVIQKSATRVVDGG